MKSGDLPNETAIEPNEGAHQPLLDKNVPHFTAPRSSKKLNFAKDVGSVEKPSSQSDSSFRDILSQVAPNLPHIDKLQWLQKRRTTGLWAQCDQCDRWRYLPNVIDRHELPKKWYCSMNSDPDFSSCSVPEAPLRLRDEEDLIHSEYTAGSLVWARLPGWSWWPAMVDDCPDAEQFYWLDGFSDIPTHYNVVFFDNMEVTRAWIAFENLKPYASNKNTFKYLLKNKKFKDRLRESVSQADLAEGLVLAKRLEKFSFLSRYKGSINSPKKVSKHDLMKYQKRFKKKFNIEFPIESSDEDTNLHDESVVKEGITLRTPKRARKDKRQTKGVKASINEKEGTQIVTESLISKNVDTDKPFNSMVAQVGSEQTTAIDNDTSTTYLPGTAEPDFSIRMETPNSDDFDF